MTFAVETFSQFGEDVLVWEFFGRKTDGFFVEVGANAPVRFSQTWLLEKNGWRGILVEPLPAKCDALRAARKNSRVFQVAVGAPDQRGFAQFHVATDDMFSSMQLRDKGPATLDTVNVQVVTLDDVLAEAGNPLIDFLSIDVEGMELNVLRGFDIARHRPKLVLLEDHMKSQSLYRAMKERNYRLVKRTGVNNWFIPSDAPFHLTNALEKFRLWKRLWIHTPLAVLREKNRARRRAK
jgi:FkbM family methyltransferase